MQRCQKAGFFNPRSSENQLTKEEERGKRKSEKKERRRRRKAIVALFVFIIVTLEFLAEKKIVGRKRSIWQYIDIDIGILTAYGISANRRKSNSKKGVKPMNDFPVIGDPCFAHRIMGSPGGKHCESLQRNVWRGVVSPLKAVSLDRECRILP